jgi:hypothetical protein
MRHGIIAMAVLTALTSQACIWDSDTLADEKRKSPELASLILASRPAPDTNALLKRVQKLKANPREEDPAWWNDLAGAYLRLGHPQEAATLLEPLLTRFPDDYAIHANLGTAYHLLGRYEEAEREIARDLELNPNGHFGLEVYHLALLQYLSRDREYQSRHVYVDEYTPSFLTGHIFGISPAISWAEASAPAASEEIKSKLAIEQEGYKKDQLIFQLAKLDAPPTYQRKWSLGNDPKFENGVRYMAELNANQPAAFVMLGMACLKKQDLHLAAAAFERAISLGSQQADRLRTKVAEVRDHIAKAGGHHRLSLGRWYRWAPEAGLALTVLALGTALLISVRKARGNRGTCH